MTTEGFTDADRVAIHELCARYNRTVDTADADGWADCFTDDGEFISLLVGSYQGRAALAAFARDYWEGDECARWRNGQHWVGNIIVTPEGPDRANVHSYHMMLVPEDGGVKIDLFAGQQDVVVRTAEGWRLQQRRMVQWPPQGAQ